MNVGSGKVLTCRFTLKLGVLRNLVSMGSSQVSFGNPCRILCLCVLLAVFGHARFSPFVKMESCLLLIRSARVREWYGAEQEDEDVLLEAFIEKRSAEQGSPSSHPWALNPNALSPNSKPEVLKTPGSILTQPWSNRKP